jgi:hypothetical protein
MTDWGGYKRVSSISSWILSATAQLVGITESVTITPCSACSAMMMMHLDTNYHVCLFLCCPHASSSSRCSRTVLPESGGTILVVNHDDNNNGIVFEEAHVRSSRRSRRCLNRLSGPRPATFHYDVLWSLTHWWFAAWESRSKLACRHTAELPLPRPRLLRVISTLAPLPCPVSLSTISPSSLVHPK